MRKCADHSTLGIARHGPRQRLAVVSGMLALALCGRCACSDQGGAESGRSRYRDNNSM
jgi:hypothetical protein